MAYRGKRFIFHGAFSSKADARRKERQGKHRFIKRKRYKGRGVRYMVMEAR